MKILQINTTINSGSTGRIAEDIGTVLIQNNHISCIAFGRGTQASKSKLIKIGSSWDVLCHGFKTAIFDKHGFGSTDATINLIREIENEKPNAIGLHNLHGYYINIKVLFKYLQKSNIPVLWTLFDCWSFTGHCSYFDDIDCKKWQAKCMNCPKKRKYPTSYIIDNSESNFDKKKELFNSLPNLHLVVHSEWLKYLVSKSFLGSVPISMIQSGIDLDQFSPQDDFEMVVQKYKLKAKKIILGVANIWDLRKGLSDFISLNKLIDTDMQIVLIGLSAKQVKSLPGGIKGIERTESIRELAMLYSCADVFVNPTWQDNFPTTNLESLACGTPVITYNTGGSPESIDANTGIVVEKGNINGLKQAIDEVIEKGKDHYRRLCRTRAEKYFNKNDRYLDYLYLYEKLISEGLNN